jgi:flagellar hook-length control protein FliK
MLDPASLPQPKPAVSPASAGSARHVAKGEAGFHGRLREALESPEGEQQVRAPRVESKSADRPDAHRLESAETKAEATILGSGSSEPAASGANIQAENDAGGTAAAPQLEEVRSPKVAGAVQTEILLTEAAVNDGSAGQEVILTANLPGSQVLAQPSVGSSNSLDASQSVQIAPASQPLASTPILETQAGAMEPVVGQADAKAAFATKQVDAPGAGVPTTPTSEIIAAQPGSVMEAEAQAVPQAAQHGAASRSAPATMADQQQNIATALAAAPAQAAAAQAAQSPQAMAGARKPAPPAPAGDAVEATKPSESLALLSNALNNIQAAREMQVVMADETAEPGLRLASLEAPKAVGTKPSGELRAEGLSMQPPAFMGLDGMLQRTDAPLPSSPAREAAAPLPARQLAPVVVSLLLGRGDEALTIALDPVELGRVEVSIGQGKEAGQIRIVAERPETLALLQRDQRELDRALNQAGLDDMGRSLSFSLASDQGRQHQQQHAAHHGANRFAGALTGIELERPQGPIPMPARAATSLLDIAV